MQDLQETLSPVLPSWAGLWQPDDEEDIPPEQFAVYAVKTSECCWGDDDAILVERTASVTLWSMVDPTEKAAEIRRAMRAAGWEMLEEKSGGTDSTTHRYSVGWTYISDPEAVS